MLSANEVRRTVYVTMPSSISFTLPPESGRSFLPRYQKNWTCNVVTHDVQSSHADDTHASADAAVAAADI